MSRDKEFPLSDELKQNARVTVQRTNFLLQLFGNSRGVASGYRPDLINAGVKNAALHSNHIICKAVDLYDPDGKLDFFCMTHQDDLGKLELWLEHPVGTPGWCHVQTAPPHSGHRVFFP